MADVTEPVVLVTMGTDHHPFGRLSSWMESWLAARGDDVRCRTQEGSSPVPAGSEALGLLPYLEFLEVIRTSTVVVCQGGPGSVMDARRCGFVPIAVPRLARFGEVVDDHQVAFCRHAAEQGWARSVETEADLHRALDLAVADPASLRCGPFESTAEATARELELRVEAMLARPRRGLHLRRLPVAVSQAVTTLRGVQVDGASSR